MTTFIFQNGEPGGSNAFLTMAGLLLAVASLIVIPAFAQAPLPTPPPVPPASAASTPPPAYPQAELDRIVSPIALYPDPLLGQVLAAATFSAEIPDAARWADEHHYLVGDQLTVAITADHLPWDPSVQALLGFPTVLDMLASDMPWTKELGDAFLAQRDAVMDAVQKQRHLAQQYGYLQPNPHLNVSTGPDIEILPVNPDYVVVPYYNPYVVFGPPPPGFAVGGAIYFGYGIHLGPWWGPWGWGTTHFVWTTHAFVLNSAPWGRTWVNRATYRHPYPGVPRNVGPRLPDQHRLMPRTPEERNIGRGAPRGHQRH